jgi:hypothetical protein
MTLRSEIEAMLVEFEHLAYRGAPLEVAIEKLQEILAKTAPRVLTTVEELDSEEASKALCLIPGDGSGILGFYGRRDGQNEWTGMGTDNYFTSAELLAYYADNGDEPRFTLIERPDVPKAAPWVLTTEAELNSPEAFETLCIVPSGGLPRTPASRSNGVNYWQEPGVEGEYSSAELYSKFAETGAKPAFTAVECSFPPVNRRVLTTLEDLNSAKAFYALCIVPYGGPLRVAMGRSNGVSYWQEPGYAGEYSSTELLAHFASIGAEPAFTVIEKP